MTKLSRYFVAVGILITYMFTQLMIVVQNSSRDHSYLNVTSTCVITAWKIGEGLGVGPKWMWWHPAAKEVEGASLPLNFLMCAPKFLLS
jgi:hypothetical protein